MSLSKLQLAVIEQLGYSEDDTDESSCEYEALKGTMSDIQNHGIDGGFSGFIYYADTLEFFDKNRSIILNELSELADELGESYVDMVKKFPCLNGDFDHEVDSVLMNIDCEDDTTVKNALSWFAAEHVAFQIEA